MEEQRCGEEQRGGEKVERGGREEGELQGTMLATLHGSSSPPSYGRRVLRVLWALGWNAQIRQLSSIKHMLHPYYLPHLSYLSHFVAILVVCSVSRSITTRQRHFAVGHDVTLHPHRLCKTFIVQD